MANSISDSIFFFSFNDDYDYSTLQKNRTEYLIIRFLFPLGFSFSCHYKNKKSRNENAKTLGMKKAKHSE